MTQLAVIGCGHWGPNHIRNFNAMPGCKVVAAADTASARLARMAEMFPGICMEQDYRRVLASPSVDAVVIATPTATHGPIVREALLAGKHVLCEKPLCPAGDEARELVALAARQQCVLMVGHVFLFNSGLLKVKELLEGEDVGRLYYLSAVRTNLGPIRSDVNSAYDLATHDISIFNWLLEATPFSASACGGAFLQPGIEDTVFISLRYPAGVVANIHASWLNPKKVRQLTIVGTRKMITWDDLELTTPVAVYDRGAAAEPDYNDYGEFLRVSMWSGDVRLPKVEIEEPLKAQAREFLRALHEHTPSRSDGEFSLGVVKTLEAVAASLRRGGAPVEIT